MPVYVTLRLQADPAAFEAAARDHADAIGRIMELAKGKGLVAHRWYGGDGIVMAVDQWPHGDDFFAFFAEAGPEIGPFLAAAGVTGEPDITVWRELAMDDVFP